MLVESEQQSRYNKEDYKMPLVSITQKKVILKGKLPEILKILDETLKAHGILDDNQKSDLMADPPQVRPNHLVLSCLEAFFDNQLGAKERTFRALTLDLDPPAFAMWESYLAYVNSLVEIMAKAGAETGKELIDSRFVLVREIFKRLVAVALCKDMGPQKDGDIVLSVLRKFIIKINQKEILNENFLGGLNPRRDAPKFSVAISTNHSDWIEDLAAMVEIIKLLHAPETAFTNVLNYFNDVKQIIIRQLISRLNPSISLDKLESDWLLNSLAECENKILGEVKRDPSQRNLVPYSVQNYEIGYQQKIIDSVGKPHKDKVNELYRLLCKTNILSAVGSYFSRTEIYSGWVLLITGFIKINALIEEISNYSKQCEGVLNLMENDPLLKSSAGKGLIRYSAVRTSQIKLGAEKCYSSLRILNNKEMITKLIEIMSTDFGTLSELQKYFENEIIDRSLLALPNIPKEDSLRSAATLINSYITESESYIQHQQLEQAQKSLNDALREVSYVANRRNFLDPQKTPSEDKLNFVKTQIKRINDTAAKIDQSQLPSYLVSQFRQDFSQTYRCLNGAASNIEQNNNFVVKGEYEVNEGVRETREKIDEIVKKIVKDRQVATGVMTGVLAVTLGTFVGVVTAGAGAPVGAIIGGSLGAGAGGSPCKPKRTARKSLRGL
jgi:hypothetical protein